MKNDIWAMLKKRFRENEYALMQEVSDAAGFNRSRSADYVAMSLWPSRGLDIIGIEKKAYRSDWLNELKNPKKAENIFQYCDYWYLLTTDDTVAKLEEIPATWGWLCVKGSKLITKKEPPKLVPNPISKNFLAALLKRGSDKTNFVHIDSIDEKLNFARQQGREEFNRSYTQLQNELKQLKENVSEFSKHSGIDLTYRWSHNPERIGKAVQFINNGGIDSLKDELNNLERTAENVLLKIREGIAI